MAEEMKLCKWPIRLHKWSAWVAIDNESLQLKRCKRCKKIKVVSVF